MKGEDIIELFKRFEQEATRINDVECWSARGLCPLLGYADWRNFLKAIEKAKESCINAGENESDHFVGVNKMVSLGSGSQRAIEDILLTRYACYLIAQNGDPQEITNRRGSLDEVTICDHIFAKNNNNSNEYN